MSKLLFKGPDHELAAERGAIIHWLRNIYWGYDINIVISTHLTGSRPKNSNSTTFSLATARKTSPNLYYTWHEYKTLGAIGMLPWRRFTPSSISADGPTCKRTRV